YLFSLCLTCPPPLRADSLPSRIRPATAASRETVPFRTGPGRTGQEEHSVPSCPWVRRLLRLPSVGGRARGLAAAVLSARLGLPPPVPPARSASAGAPELARRPAVR